MLSYIELRRIVGVLESELTGTVVRRIVQADDFCLAISFRGDDGERIVFLSCRPDFARLTVLPEMPNSPQSQYTLGQYARAHLTRAAFREIRLAQANRQVAIRLETAGGWFDLILSILGARSNLYILDPKGNLAHSMRPLDETRRELVLGARWSDPEGTLTSQGEDRWPHLDGLPFVEEVERSYRQKESAREAENLSRKLDSVLGREANFLARKCANLLEDLREAREAETHRRKGEMLKSAMHLIEPGDESLTVTDYETGEPVVIPLDAALSPAENLETYFRRYRKEQRSVTAIEQQIDAVRKAQLEMETLQSDLRGLLAVPEPSLAGLREFSGRHRVRQLLARHSPGPRQKPALKKEGKKEIPGRLRPKRYRTESGLEIWVGRSDESNDYLTTRLARGNDLFFHLEGYPGSHVILRTEGRTDPPAESVLAACELAVHFSKMKDAGRADVHVAHVKDIKKPRGAKPGLVYVSRGKTVHLRRDPKRLESILASRLDE